MAIISPVLGFLITNQVALPPLQTYLAHLQFTEAQQATSKAELLAVSIATASPKVWGCTIFTRPCFPHWRGYGNETRETIVSFGVALYSYRTSKTWCFFQSRTYITLLIVYKTFMTSIVMVWAQDISCKECPVTMATEILFHKLFRYKYHLKNHISQIQWMLWLPIIGCTRGIRRLCTYMSRSKKMPWCMFYMSQVHRQKAHAKCATIH